MSFAIIRAEKHKSLGTVASSLSHNYRTRETPNADPERTPKNQHTVPTADEAKTAIKARIPEKHRSDAVLVLEYFVGTSPEWMAKSTPKEQNDFFNDSLKFLQARHGKENVIAATIHRDESTPHMAVYIVPIDEKGVLNAKKFTGGRQVMSQLQTDFHNHVERHGLERGIKGSKAKHKTIQQYYAEIQAERRQPVVPELKPKVFETSGQMAKRIKDEIMEALSPQWNELVTKANEAERLKKENETLTSTLKRQQQSHSRIDAAFDKLHVNNDRRLLLSRLEADAEIIRSKREQLRQEKLEAERRAMAERDAERKRQAVEKAAEKAAAEAKRLAELNAKREREGKKPLEQAPTRSRGGMSR